MLIGVVLFSTTHTPTPPEEWCSLIGSGAYTTGIPKEWCSLYKHHRKRRNKMMILRRALLYTIGVVLAILLVLLMLTPDKTYDGQYVNFYKYWTDNAYFNEVIGRI